MTSCMNFLSSINQELDAKEEKNRAKGTFYSLLNYLVVNDEDNASGIKKKELEERFSLRTEYFDILSLLMEKDVVQQKVEDKYSLNPHAKQFLSPLLKNLLASAYKDRYHLNCDSEKENCSDYKILMDCRSLLFSS